MRKKSESVKFEFGQNPSLPNGTMTKDEMLLEMQLEAEPYLMKIEQVFKRWNLHMDRLTLIARATNNDDMIVVLTNESRAGLPEACRLAIKNQLRTVSRENPDASQVEEEGHP